MPCWIGPDAPAGIMMTCWGCAIIGEMGGCGMTGWPMATAGCIIGGAIMGCAIAIAGCCGAGTEKVKFWPGCTPIGTITCICWPPMLTTICWPPGTVACTDMSCIMKRRLEGGALLASRSRSSE